MGELCGIIITSELHAILKAVLALPQCRRPGTTTTGNEATSSNDSPPEFASEECNDDKTAAVAAAASIADPRPTTVIITQFPRMTVDSATSILNAAVMASTPTASSSTKQKNGTAITNNNNNENKHSSSLKTPSLSLEGVIAAKFLIDQSINDFKTTTTEDTAPYQLLLHQLEKALRSSTLSFDSSSNSNNTTNATSSSSSSSTANNSNSTRAAFAKRLERLRLHTEERSYSRLTTNIQHPAANKSADDITVKSMTYAASVGLNMIVGPLAFGTFMYFFAGGVLDHFFLVDITNNDNDNNNSSNHYSGHSGVGGGVDVRRVIAGVLSGAFMLFVEMILFVIRSHELDASVRKKGKRAEYRANPFGYTQKSMARTYVGGD